MKTNLAILRNTLNNFNGLLDHHDGTYNACTSNYEFYFYCCDCIHELRTLIKRELEKNSIFLKECSHMIDEDDLPTLEKKSTQLHFRHDDDVCRLSECYLNSVLYRYYVTNKKDAEHFLANIKSTAFYQLLIELLDQYPVELSREERVLWLHDYLKELRDQLEGSMTDHEFLTFRLNCNRIVDMVHSLSPDHEADFLQNVLLLEESGEEKVRRYTLLESDYHQFVEQTGTKIKNGETLFSPLSAFAGIENVTFDDLTYSEEKEATIINRRKQKRK